MSGGSVQGCYTGLMVGAKKDSGGEVVALSDLPCAVDVRGVVFWGYGQAIRVGADCDVAVELCHFHDSVCKTEPAAHARYDAAGGAVSHRHCGVVLMDTDWILLRRCTFDGTQTREHPCGVYAARVTGLQIQECTFEFSNPTGDSVELLDCVGAVIEDCTFTGANGGVLSSSSRAVVQRSSFGKALCCGITAGNSSRILLQKCVFTKCAWGVVVEEQSEVTAHECAMVQVQRAVTVEDTGGVFTCSKSRMEGGSVLVEAERQYSREATADLRFTDCQFSDAGMGLRVWGTGAATTLQRCTISGCDVGLYMADEVAVCMTDCTVDKCDLGMVVGLHQLDTMDQCGHCRKEGMHAWATARQHVSAAKNTATRLQNLKRCVHEGAVARLRLEGVEVWRCRQGVRVFEFGLLEAQGLRLHKCAQAVAVAHIWRHSGECSTFRGCFAIACGAGGNVMRVWPQGVKHEAGCTESEIHGLVLQRGGRVPAVLLQSGPSQREKDKG